MNAIKGIYLGLAFFRVAKFDSDLTGLATTRAVL